MFTASLPMVCYNIQENDDLICLIHKCLFIPLKSAWARTAVTKGGKTYASEEN